MSRTVFIDADACPTKREAIDVARNAGLQVVLVGNSSQNFDRYTRRNGVEAVTVSTGQDSADFAIVERLKPDDIVVTQDIGVAAMSLGRGAQALSPRGKIFHKATIDSEMQMRHLEARHRRSGGRTGGPRKFTEDDREHFKSSLQRLITAKLP